MIGQKIAIRSVYQRIASGKFPHATILSGKPGYGTLPFALNVIKALCCAQVNDQGPCNQCNACHRVNTLQYPDMHMAFPVVTAEGKIRKHTISEDFMVPWREKLLSNPYFTIEDWASSIAKTTAIPDINTAEVDHIIRQLSLKAFIGEIKVQLIWMAQYVGDQSNKLLKIIEEPPPNTYFLLVVLDAASVLPTILSRCQHIRLGPIGDQELGTYLQQEHHIPSPRTNELVSYANGDYLEALSMLEMNYADSLAKILSWWQVCANYDLISIVEWSKDFHEGNAIEKASLIKYAIKLLKGILHYKTIGENQRMLTNEELKAIRQSNFIERMEIEQFQKIHTILADLLTGIARNLHTKTQMFNSSLLIESAFNSNVNNPV